MEAYLHESVLSVHSAKKIVQAIIRDEEFLHEYLFAALQIIRIIAANIPLNLRAWLRPNSDDGLE